MSLGSNIAYWGALWFVLFAKLFWFLMYYTWFLYINEHQTTPELISIPPITQDTAKSSQKYFWKHFCRLIYLTQVQFQSHWQQKGGQSWPTQLNVYAHAAHHSFWHTASYPNEIIEKGW